MIGSRKFKKYFAAMMTSALLTVPPLQTFGNDLEKDLSDEKFLENTHFHGVNAMASKGKHVITLITGDVVTVTTLAGGKSVINVESADNAGGGSRILTVNDDTYVIPDQAMPYLASGYLDQDLFNITTLLEDGFDDASQKTLPVIVQYSESKARSVANLSAPKGSKKTHELESINGAAVSANKKEAKTFWQEITKNMQPEKGSKSLVSTGIEKIWLDGRVEATLEQSVSQVGAPTAWNSGLDGKGVKVAVLDTGIDAEHPDIADQLVESKSFVPEEDVRDFHAHGTHVASTVLGTGAASQGKNKGVAPGADLLVGKVLNNEGFGHESWIIDGMEWAAHNAKIINMSLGSGEQSDGTDPMAQAVESLSTETGSLFVIAAGNTGAEGIGSPGAAASALTVGAVDKSDRLAWFSSKGPSYGSEGLKPDLTAPGEGIHAARSQFTNNGSGSYLSMNGTSMATPHVAGAAAILAQQHPDWTGVQLKDALMSTTKKIDTIKPLEGGTGRLDLAAVTSSIVRATGSVDFGFFDWPHDDRAPIGKTITYTNESDQAIRLDLSAEFKDSDSNDAPAGMLGLSSNTVTVPAKGSVDVIVSLDPELGALGTRYQGHLTAAQNGQKVVHTSLAMIKEEEKYPLTIKATDRDGALAQTYFYLLGPNGIPQFMSVDGIRELRLVPGVYSVMSMIEVDKDTDHRGIALVGDPEINLNGPKTVELDARKANEINVNVPKEAEPDFRKMDFYRNTGDSSVNDIYIMPVWVDKMYAQPTEKVEKGEMVYATRWRLAKPKLTINFQGKILDDIPQAGSTLLKGTHSLKTVYAGKGTNADYAGLDVKGKAVVVERSDEVNGLDRSAAALAAGAKLLITVNDQPQELSEFVGIVNEDYSLSNTPLSVAAVSGTEGGDLIEAAKTGKLTLNVKGSPESEFVYDLVDMHKGAVPKDLTYSPKTNDLVKIDTRYKSDRPAPGSEFRYDILTHSHHGVGFNFELPLPSVRTEWVSAQEGTSWYHQAGVLDSEWEVRQPKVTYKPGQKLEEEWFSPVVRPRLGDGFWVPYRDRNTLILNLPAWADSGDGHTGADMTYPGEQTIKLYRGDALLSERKGQALYYFNGLPAENTEYRVVSEASRDESRWNTSVHTKTEWTFWSKYEEAFRTSLPLLSLDYKVDTDMSGNGIAGKNTKLGLSVYQIPGAAGNGVVEGATLEVSFDEGQTWKEVTLVAGDKGWTTTIKHPNKKGSFVSLRASAWDDKGNKIKQEIMKAYGLN